MNELLEVALCSRSQEVHQKILPVCWRQLCAPTMSLFSKSWTFHCIHQQKEKWVTSHHCNLLLSNTNLWKFWEQGLPLLHVTRVSINYKDFPVERSKEIHNEANSSHSGVDRRWQPVQHIMRGYCDIHQYGSRLLNGLLSIIIIQITHGKRRNPTWDCPGLWIKAESWISVNSLCPHCSCGTACQG